MATYTDNYQLTKPTYAEQADIGVINSNMNKIDEIMHSSQISLADAYDSTKTYAEGDVVMYELLMYKCISPTTGNWDASKWERTTASESGGGGSAELDILGEASGAVASFADGASAGLAKCIAEINPTQDLHGYDKPWAGGTGKNKFNTTASSKTESGVTWTVNADGTITVSGTAGGYTSIIAGSASVVGYSGNVIISGLDETTNIVYNVFTLKNANNVTIDTISVGTNTNQIIDLSQYANVAIIVVEYKRGSNGAVSGTIKTMIESGTTATTYAPYSNICPISGWDEVNVGVSGVNVWDEEWEVGGISNTTGQNTINNSTIRTKNYIPVVPNTQYYINSSKWQFVAGYDADKKFVGMVSYASSGTGYYINVPSNVYYIRIPFSTAYGTTYNHDISINYPSTDTTYEPYNGSITTIPLDRTVYGGTLDVTRGILTVTWGYIASYNGESLPSEWISDRDEYASGTTPTTGAEVAYKLATPQTVQLTPQEVNSLLGQNNISADTGDIDIVYVKASAPIQPNPTGEPTATLTKLGIEGIVFEVSSGGGGSSGGIVIDRTERVIGTYFGKPLYQRTITLNQTMTSTNYYTILTATSEKLIGYKPEATFFLRDNGQIWSSAFGYDGATVFVYQETNGNIMFSFKASGVTLSEAEITITYTKITD